MRVVHKTDACALSPADGPIRLAVAFGDGQIGTSMVLVEGTVIAAGADLQQVPLGDAAALHGKTAVVRSLVSWTNPATMQFSVVHGITGGRTHESYIVSNGCDDDVWALIAETIRFAVEPLQR